MMGTSVAEWEHRLLKQMLNVGGQGEGQHPPPRARLVLIQSQLLVEALATTFKDAGDVERRRWVLQEHGAKLDCKA